MMAADMPANTQKLHENIMNLLLFTSRGQRRFTSKFLTYLLTCLFYKLIADLTGFYATSVLKRLLVRGRSYKISYDNLTIVLLSYDNAKVTIDLRRSSDLQNVARRA